MYRNNNNYKNNNNNNNSNNIYNDKTNYFIKFSFVITS